MKPDPRRSGLAPALAISVALAAGAAYADSATLPKSELEEVYVLRSIREPHTAVPGWCSRERTGFDLFASDAQRLFSFWSIRTRPEDGLVADAGASHVADLRGCFGPTDNPARQNFHAEIELGAMAFQGRGECLALAIDFPEPGLFPVRCHLVLSGMPAPYVGGVLTTNTLTSRAAFGGATEPQGYTQASFATIRLWKAR